MSEHHATRSPSSLPMLSKCPCFEREGGSDKYRDHGTKMHEAIANILQGKDGGALLTKDADNVMWAVDHVRAFATKEFPIEIEQRLSLSDDQFSLITFGTVDVINGDWIIDWKSLEAHDYWYQMAAYALMLMQRSGHRRTTVDIGYLSDRQIERHIITKTEAEDKLGALFLELENPYKKPKANEFCKWCKNLTTCEAVAGRVTAVANGRKDWEPEIYESSKIMDPEEMVKALKIANLLKEWCESVIYHAKEMAKAGPLPGFEIKERKGNREIKDAVAAFEALDILEPNEFLSACTIGVGKLEEAIATKQKISARAAKNLLNETLGTLVTRGPSAWLLKQEKPTLPATPEALEDTATES